MTTASYKTYVALLLWRWVVEDVVHPPHLGHDYTKAQEVAHGLKPAPQLGRLVSGEVGRWGGGEVGRWGTQRSIGLKICFQKLVILLTN